MATDNLTVLGELWEFLDDSTIKAFADMYVDLERFVDDLDF